MQQAGNRTFDDAKLAMMVEPLTIRIDKKKGSTRMPIPMPPSEDGRPPGTGLAKDDLRGIEQWLVNEWAGGGYYEITVTDASTPQPLTMKWEPFWNPNEYPEKMPPPLAEGAAAAAAQRPQSVAAPIPQPQVNRMATPAFPGGFPPGLPQQQAQAPAPQTFGQQSFYGGGYPYYGANMGGGYAQNAGNQQAWQAEAERRRTEDERGRAEEQRKLLEEEKRKLQAEVQAAREASMRRDYESQLERERNASNERVKAVEAQMTELRNMMSNFTQTMQTNTARNPELEALREANRVAQERIERDAREREVERREREMRDMMKAQYEATQKQIEAMQRQFEQTQERIARDAASNNNRGPDPLIMMMQEQTRMQVEALKDMQRNAAGQMQQMQGFMMRPQDMLMLTKESQASTDQLAERMARQYSGVMDLQTKAVEQLLQLQPQGGGAAELIRDGLGQVKDLAERYVGAQQAKAQVAAQTQVEMANVQLRAMEIESRQRNPQATPHVVYAPPPPHVEAQLAGPSTGRRKKPKKPPTAATETSSTLAPKRLGRTDIEWFGPLLAEVIQLRDGVAQYMESLAMTPHRLDKEGNPVGISVDQASTGIVTAMQMVMQAGVPVPAMVDLLNQQQYADFMDVLLPDAPQNYRDDVVGATIAKLKQMGIDKPAKAASQPGNTGTAPTLVVTSDGDDDEDDDDDDDEDDDDDAVQAQAGDDGDPDRDDDNDGRVVPPPPTPINTAPRRNGRARA